MRFACRAAVVAALKANTDLANVQIEHCWPGDQKKPESIWLNPTQGVDVKIPAFRGPAAANNPVMLDDTFSIPIEIIVSNMGDTPIDAETRVGVLQRAVIATITAAPDLATFTKPSGWQIIDAVVAALEGPGTARGHKGAQSYASVVLHVHARKT